MTGPKENSGFTFPQDPQCFSRRSRGQHWSRGDPYLSYWFAIMPNSKWEKTAKKSFGLRRLAHKFFALSMSTTWSRANWNLQMFLPLSSLESYWRLFLVENNTPCFPDYANKSALKNDLEGYIRQKFISRLRDELDQFAVPDESNTTHPLRYLFRHFRHWARTTCACSLPTLNLHLVALILLIPAYLIKSCIGRLN